MMEKLLYIVRHGETDFNRQHIVQGQGVDTSLNEKGIEQANLFFNHYKEIEFDLVITSALKRSQETMAPFINQGIPWVQYPEINEISWGVQEGKKSTPEMREYYAHIMESWSSGHYDIGIEGGETARQMGDRLKRFVDLIPSFKEEKILICSHGRAMRALICLMKKEPLKNMQQYQHKNTGLYKAKYQNGQFEFLLHNDLSHINSI
jgi:broad specificity phosphatase PhoE